MSGSLQMLLVLSAGVLVLVSPGMAADKQINLVDFGSVVQFAGESPEVGEPKELQRETDGWTAWKRDDGQYMIGVEWDEPRDLARVHIEFRHAIANRRLVQVQYWREAVAQTRPQEGLSSGQPRRGQWLTPHSEWWAGDRDVFFTFLPPNEEEAGVGVPQAGCRRTRWLRFFCGKDEPPPVRYLEAFGPRAYAEATLEVRFDDRGRMTLPVMATVVNGYALASDGKTTMESARIGDSPGMLRIRYADQDLDSPNRTTVSLRSVEEPIQELSFVPAEVAKSGVVRLPAMGVVIERRNGKPAGQPGAESGSRPSRYDIDPG